MLTLLCVVKRGDSESSHHRGKTLFFFYFLYLYEMTDVNETYCGHHFTIHVSQVIMLYTLFSVVCQLYLNKTTKNKNKKPLPKQQFPP